MKKLFAIMLAVLMVLTFAACGDDDNNATGNNLFGGAGEVVDTPTTDVETPVVSDSTITEEPYNSAIATTPDTYLSSTTTNSSAIQDYIDANKYTILSSMEQSFANSSGMTCSSSIEVIGNGFVIRLNINELNNIDSNTKAQMQTAYDSMSGTFSGMLDDLQTEVPELEYFTIHVCEADGDILATINAR